VPDILDAIKAELNRRSAPARYVPTGSTRYQALPHAAQSLTGRATVVPVRPLSQGEIDGIEENWVARLLTGDTSAPTSGHLTREDYAGRILTGGFPQALAIPDPLRAQWFADYVSLVCERDVIALSKVRQRARLPWLLSRLAAQTAQLVNMSEAARSVGLETSTAENYTHLSESVCRSTSSGKTPENPASKSAHPYEPRPYHPEPPPSRGEKRRSGPVYRSWLGWCRENRPAVDNQSRCGQLTAGAPSKIGLVVTLGNVRASGSAEGDEGANAEGADDRAEDEGDPGDHQVHEEEGGRATGRGP
jgi:hypothetical protein